MATVASLVVNLTASTSQLEKGFLQATRLTDRFVKSTKSVTRQLDEIARYGRNAGLALTAMSLSVRKLVKASADHEESMLRVKAVARATVQEYHTLSAAALQTSTTTRHSLSSIGEGMKFLAMAGFQAKEIAEMIPVVTRMATAGAVDMVTAADITTNILFGYGMAVEDLSRATDVLVAAFTGANVTLQLLGETFKHVGPVAKSAGMEFEEIVAAAALLGNAGIQGSIAGTSLKSAISRLISPSNTAARILKRLGVETTTSEGKLRDLADIIDDLSKAGATTADVLRIFGLRAGPSMARLLDLGADALRQYTQRLRDSEGWAELIEAEQMQSFNAQFDLTKNIIHAFSIELGDVLLPYMKTLNWLIGDLVGSWRDLDDATKDNVIRIAVVGGAILAFITVLGLVAGAISMVIKGFTTLGIILGLVTSGPVLTILGIALAVGYLKKAWDENWGGIQEKTIKVLGEIQNAFDNFLVWLGGEKLKERVYQYWADLVAVWGSEELTFIQKIGKSLELTTDLIFGEGTTARVIARVKQFWAELKTVWVSEELTFGQKVSQTARLLAELLLGEERVQAIVDYWNNLKTTWDSEELTFTEKIGKTITLTAEFLFGEEPGKKIVEFWNQLKGIWDNEEDTFLQKLGKTILLTKDFVIENALLSIGLATLVAVTAWKIMPWVLTGLAGAITKALAPVGLALGKVAVGSILLVLTAGAIGWLFGDKEDKDAWTAAIKESLTGMFGGELSIPAGVFKIAEATFELGTAGLENFRKEIQEFNERLKKWDPTESIESLDPPDWAMAFWDMGKAAAEFFIAAFATAFDIGQILITLFEKGMQRLGKELSDMIASWFGIEVPAELEKQMEEYYAIEKRVLAESGLSNWEIFIGKRPEGFPRTFAEWVEQGMPSYEEIIKRMRNVYDSVWDIPESELEKYVTFGPTITFPYGFDPRSGTWLPGTGPEIEDIIRLQAQSDVFANLRDTLAENNIVLDEYLIRLGKSESGLHDLTSSVSSARGEFQLLADTRAKLEQLLGTIDWEDPAQRTYAAIHWLRLGIENEFGIIADAANRLGVTLEEAIKLWWVAGGPKLRTLESLDVVLTLGKTGREILAGFAGGGYTGNYPVDEVVGVVHGQEIVIPAYAVRKGMTGILEFLGVPGFQEGRVPSMPGVSQAGETLSWMQDIFNDIADVLLAGLATLFEYIIRAVEVIAVALVGEEKAEEIKAKFQSFYDGISDLIQKMKVTTPPTPPEPEEEVDIKWWLEWLVDLEEAMEEFDWSSPINNFVNTLANGLAQAESYMAQFAGEMVRLIKHVVQETEDGTRQIVFDFDNMIAQMANSLATMIAESLVNLLSGYDIPQQRKDLFPNLTELLDNLENYAENQERLRKLKMAPDLATIGGAGAGALIGSAFGPLGTLIGGFLGGLAGRKSAQAATKREIEELTEKLKTDFLAIKEMLGTTMQDVANGLARAFSAETYEDFVNQFSQNLESQVKNALITAFMASDVVRPLIDELSNQISLAVMDGMLDANERDSILGLYDQIVSVSGDFFNSLQELGIATGDVADGMKELSDAMRNVPQGLKIVSNRLAAAGYSVPGIQSLSDETGGGGAVYHEVHVHVEGGIYGVDELYRVIKRAAADAYRRMNLATYGVG